VKRIYLITLMVFYFIGCTVESKIKLIDVSDYGITPNTGMNTSVEINRLIEGLDDEAVTIVFPKGRYDFYPDSSYFKEYFETNTV
jgi:hypothetical protein